MAAIRLKETSSNSGHETWVWHLQTLSVLCLCFWGLWVSSIQFWALLSLHWAPNLMGFPVQGRSAESGRWLCLELKPLPFTSDHDSQLIGGNPQALILFEDPCGNHVRGAPSPQSPLLRSAGSVLSPVLTSTLGISGGSHKVFYWSFDSNTFWLLMTNVHMK